LQYGNNTTAMIMAIAIKPFFIINSFEKTKSISERFFSETEPKAFTVAGHHLGW